MFDSKKLKYFYAEFGFVMWKKDNRDEQRGERRGFGRYLFVRKLFHSFSFFSKKVHLVLFISERNEKKE